MAKMSKQEIKVIDPVGASKKADKKAAVGHFDGIQKHQEGGSWPGQGFGTIPDPKHYIKTPEHSDFKKQEPNTKPGGLSIGDMPSPVNVPTLAHHDASLLKHLGHFSSDKVMRDGHRAIEAAEKMPENEKTESKADKKKEDE